MRVVVPVATLTLFLSGCTSAPPASAPPASAPPASAPPARRIEPGPSTQPDALPSAAGPWRVVPLNTNNFPHFAAILLNEQTGDTWIYRPDEWRRITRE